MSSATPEPTVERKEARLPVVDESGSRAELTLALPRGARDAPEAALPTVDVSAVAGASIALRRAFDGDDGARLYALCARAPSDRWAPGLEELVLERANAIARGALDGEVERFAAHTIEPVAGRFEQRFEGALRRDARALTVAGKHVLGFAGEARDAVLCTVMCTAPAQDAPRCEALIEAAQASGRWTEAPPPSLLIRSILLAANHPEGTLGVAGAMAIAACALLLARRPRPRW